MSKPPTRASLVCSIGLTSVMGASSLGALPSPSTWHVDQTLEQTIQMTSTTWTVRASAASTDGAKTTFEGPIAARSSTTYIRATRATLDGDQLVLSDGVVHVDDWSLPAHQLTLDPLTDSVQLTPPYASTAGAFRE